MFNGCCGCSREEFLQVQYIFKTQSDRLQAQDSCILFSLKIISYKLSIIVQEFYATVTIRVFTGTLVHLTMIIKKVGKKDIQMSIGKDAPHHIL